MSPETARAVVPALRPGPGVERRRAVVLAVLLVLAVLVGRESRPDGAQLALVWPAAGVVVVWLLAAVGTRAWAPALLGALVTSFLVVEVTGAGIFLSTGVSAATVLQGAVLAHVYARRRGDGPSFSLRTPTDLWWFLGAAALACAVGSLVGGLTAVLDHPAGPAGAPPFAVVAGQWFVRHLVGVVVVGAVGLRLLDREVAWARPPWLAGPVEQRLMTLALVAGYGVVLVWLPVLPLAFAVLPLHAWLALRRRTTLTTLHVAVAAAAVLAATLLDAGPFAALGPQAAAPTAQAFVLVVTTVSLLLSLARDERDVLLARAAEATAATARQAALLEAVVGSTTGGLSVFAADGTPLLRNAAAERLVGPWPATGGRRAWAEQNRLARPDGTPYPFDELPITRALAGESVRESDVVLRPEGASPRTVSTSAVPLPPGPEPWSGGVVASYGDVTAVRAAAVDLAQARDLYRGVLDAATEQAIIGTDDRGLVTVFNVGAEQMLGYRAADVLGRGADLFHDGREVVARAAELGIAPGLEVFVVVPRQDRHETRQWTYVRADGRRLQVMLTMTARRDADGRITGYIGVATDVTERVLAEQRLADSEALFRLAFDTAPTAMLMVGLVGADLGRVLRANDAGALLVGVPADALVGRTVMQHVHPGERGTARGRLRAVLAGRAAEARFEQRLVQADGTVRWGALTASVVRPGAGAPYLLLLVEDVTERRAAEERLSHLATHDGLTGLANRALLRERLEEAVAAAGRGEGAAGLLFVDLDGFKAVNDGHGHAAGDEVLRQVAARLEHVVAGQGTAARLGGDEFAVVVPSAGAAQLQVLAGLLLAEVRRPVRLPDGATTAVGASIGLRRTHGGVDAEELLGGADAAMYEAKRSGGGRVVDGTRSGVAPLLPGPRRADVAGAPPSSSDRPRGLGPGDPSLRSL
ncbi:sensor domain-containing protein [Pseudokineococcus lusitanus]|uniref:Diguanylate cyclase with PAS/PAC sensor n=1 Tax=Pseudokineococcus lusitanus TaxID=763993 RepID=A0A3N1G9W6_9ACTN|nr:diguanylate cyclase [Pseudokineococcus lusitanus]ROP26968.1 diguanylate cyclase with PAS/PAC sensor [Pseudokineococcus lusitanus]